MIKIKKEKKEKKVIEPFNKEIKEEFLSMYPENTQATYRRIFQKSSSIETALNKDLYEFNRLEIEDILYDLDPLTPAVSQSNGRIMTSYINWAIDKKLSKNVINPLKTVDGDWFDRFVDKSKKLYFTEQEIRDYESKCKNAQDAVIIRLLFEGINGKEAIEIRNLHKKDIDRKNNILTLRDENGNETRKVQVDKRVMELVIDAFEETTYYKKNGQMEEVENVRNYTDLIETDYVIRTSYVRKDSLNYGAVQPSVIYRRVSSIGETLGIPYFTTKNIFRSGVIYMGFQMLEIKKGLGIEPILTTEDYIELARKFEIKNHYTIKEYCNEEIINELYT